MVVRASSGSSGGGGLLYKSNVTGAVARAGVDTGIKATDASFACMLTDSNLYNACLGGYATISSGAVTMICYDYADIYVNGSGNIELKSKLNSDSAYPKMNIYVC